MQSIRYENGSLFVLDQTMLPSKESYKELKTYRDAGYALADMVVRGASLCAIVMAYGMILAAEKARSEDVEIFREDVYAALDFFEKTRINSPLSHAYLAKMREMIQNEYSIEKIKSALDNEVKLMTSREKEYSKGLVDKCSGIISDNDSILTYSNYGALASVSEGSVIPVICEGVRAHNNIKVYCAETRPYLQGAKLTAWEFKKHGIDVTVITDNAAAFMMKTGKINKVITGADRIAKNGDIVAKIGTYMLALSAKANNVPFYVAAPSFLVDDSLIKGSDSAIEERPISEVAYLSDITVVPEGIKIINPVFDVTEAALITALATEKGIEKNLVSAGTSAIA